MAKNDTDSGSMSVAAQPTRGGTRRMAIGAAWMIAARWCMRSIGLVSTIVLARLLRPEDFGLVAMGALTVQFVLVFADAGQALAVIRNTNATHEHFDTSWTMSVAIGTVVALILVATAPFAGWYFHDDRAVAVVRFLALKPFINGFTNVGILSFRKELRFGKDFQFLVLQRVTVFVATIVLAIILRSYWALAIGNVCGEVLSVALSYMLHPYRPRFRLTRLREIYAYSMWMQFANIGTYFGDQADQLVVGSLAGTQAMGLYNVSMDLASAPTDEFVVPTSRAMFPIYASLQHDPARFAEAYLSVLSAIAVIALSTGIGVALVAPDLVAVVLGPKWAAAAPFISWLAVGSGLLGVTRSVNVILTVTGSGSLAAMRNWLFIALLIPAVIVGGIHSGTWGVAVARLVVVLLFTPVMFYTVMHVIPVTTSQIVARTYRPALAAIAMAAAVIFGGTSEIATAPMRLAANVSVGAGVFAVVLILLWLVAGRPLGVEATVFEQAGRLWQGTRLRRAQ